MLPVLVILSISTLFAQYKHDYVWFFGYGDPAVEFGGKAIFDFNKNPSELFINSEIPLNFGGSDASMCDKDGNLLFYSNGCHIANSTHQIMENGAMLNPGGNGFWDNVCPELGYTVNKSPLIIPMPGSDSLYILFHIAGTFSQTPPYVYANKLYYSIVDMSKELGLGAVILKNQLILQDTFQYNELTAVKHQNNSDWWIIASKGSSNIFFKIYLTQSGITDISMQSIGDATHPNSGGSGMSVFSANGKVFARCNQFDPVYLYDFDRNNGELSNFRKLVVTDSTGGGGVCFSPNNRFLYVSAEYQIFQFDMLASDVQDSRTMVGQYDFYYWLNFFPTNFFLSQLGPDCRIYISTPSSVPFLHVINYPNERGSSCGFMLRGINLPSVNDISLPNFPNYRLGTPYPVCDSSIVLSVSSLPPAAPMQEWVRVYPNPTVSGGEVTVAFVQPIARPGEWALYDGLGRLLHRERLAAGQAGYTFSLPEAPPGLYFWSVSAAGARVQGGKLIISK